MMRVKILHFSIKEGSGLGYVSLEQNKTDTFVEVLFFQ
jgi:hypothetical protein